MFIHIVYIRLHQLNTRLRTKQKSEQFVHLFHVLCAIQSLLHIDRLCATQGAKEAKKKDFIIFYTFAYVYYCMVIECYVNLIFVFNIAVREKKSTELCFIRSHAA